MISFPFTAIKTINQSTGEVEYDRAINSEQRRAFNNLRYTDGVDYTKGEAFQVIAQTGMRVDVLCNGVWCKVGGAFGLEPSAIRTMELNASNTTQDRIDRVVLRMELTNSVRSVDLYVLTGTPALSPTPPELTRNNTIWEICIAEIFIAKESVNITNSVITDTRFNTEVCGIMGNAMHDVDFSPYFNQINALVEEYKADSTQSLEDLQTAIDNIVAGSESMLKLTYDPNQLGVDVTIQSYTHTSLNSIVGTGANGYFTATVSGTVSQINGMAVKAGEETEVELIAGVMYWFTIVGNTINFRQGGASRNYKIIASTTQPTSPKENTIWINTETPMPSNGWAFANENPFTAPITGNIWLQTKDTATIELSTSKNFVEQQRINNIYQYDSETWKPAEFKIYQNGEWIENALRLLVSGVVQTGEFKKGTGAGTTGFTQEDGYIKMSAANGSYSGFYFDPQIDFSKYSTLKAKVQAGYAASTYIGVANGIDYYSTYYARKDFTSTLSEITIDISSVTSTGYVLFSVPQNNYANIYDIELLA